VNKAGK